MLIQVTTQAVIIISQVKQEAIPYVLFLAFDALVILQIVKISKHFWDVFWTGSMEISIGLVN